MIGNERKGDVKDVDVEVTRPPPPPLFKISKWKELLQYHAFPSL